MSRPRIGFIGVGEMGAPMAANLLQAGYELWVHDRDPERQARLAALGAHGVDRLPELLEQVTVVCTSLPSSAAWVQLVESALLPNVTAGQTVIDLGTVIPPACRRLAAQFAARAVSLLDVPVSGGPGGVMERRLYMFAGGDLAAFRRMRPILEAIGGGERITYCGPSGSGQVVKGVNQLMMGLGAAAYLEALAFGVCSGIDIKILLAALGDQGPWRPDLQRVARRIAQGEGTQVGVKFRELPYFLEAAEEAAFALPLTAALREFCEPGGRIVIDDHRPAPSFWHQLTGAASGDDHPGNPA